MAEDQAKIQIPQGMKLVDEDKFKTLAAAGNDLKKLKAAIPDGFDISTLGAIVDELGTLKNANKSEIEKLTATVDKLVGKDADRKAENQKLKDANKRLLIDNKVGEGLSIGAAEGTYVDTAFVDKTALYKLDPDDAAFEDNVKTLLKNALEKQQAFLMKIGAKGSPKVGEAIQSERGVDHVDHSKAAAVMINKRMSWPWQQQQKKE